MLSNHAESEDIGALDIGEERPQIPGYVIGELLGRGGSGAVYHATQTALDRPVAIKFLRQDLALTKDRSERLHRESQSLARVQHPHILSVIDSGEVGGERYVVMEYAPGGDLRGLMKDSGRLAPDRVAQVVGQSAAALDHAHREGIIHRDIKPENLLLDSEGNVRLGDFGLAASSGSGGRLTEEGMRLGTPGYMAPEQQLGDSEAVDHRADIFALGCLAYETLTGKVPSGQPALPSETKGVPVAVDSVVLRAMAASPEDRFVSAGAFALALKQGLHPRVRSARVVGLGIAAAVIAACIWGYQQRFVSKSDPLALVAETDTTVRLSNFLTDFLNSTSSQHSSGRSEESFFEFPIPVYYDQRELTREAFLEALAAYKEEWIERFYVFVKEPAIVEIQHLPEGELHHVKALFAYEIESAEVTRDGQKQIQYHVLERPDGSFVIRSVFEIEEPKSEELYWPPERYERAQVALLERLQSSPQPIDVGEHTWNALMAKYDKGIEIGSNTNRVLRATATPSSELEGLFDEVVDYMEKGLMKRSDVLEEFANYRAVWLDQWHFLQAEPRVAYGKDAVETNLRCVHVARGPRRFRKWDLQLSYMTIGDIISNYQSVSHQTVPWTEEERLCLLDHFCRHYYMAGCAASDLNQLSFLNDPTYYLDEEKSLAAISQGLEEYHSLRPNRHLELQAAPEIARLASNHYLAACKFTASRGNDSLPVMKTDLMQIRFIEDEPRIVCILSLP